MKRMNILLAIILIISLILPSCSFVKDPSSDTIDTALTENSTTENETDETTAKGNPFNKDSVIAAAELTYKQSGKIEDLIILSSVLMESNRYDKMYEYLPEVVQMGIEDFTETYNKIHAENPMEAEDDSEFKYSLIVFSCLLSYISTEHYDEYQEAFLPVYETIIQNGDETIWNFCVGRMSLTGKVSQEGYDVMLKSLQDICPDPNEIVQTFVPGESKIFTEYGNNSEMQIEIYRRMGNEEMVEKINQERDETYKQLIEKGKEMRKAKEEQTE